MNIEMLLEAYPGLWLKRCAVSATGKRFALDKLIASMQQTKVCPAGMLLPPSMEWYTKKQWQQRGSTVASLAFADDGRPSKTELEKVLDTVGEMKSKIDKLAVDQHAGFQEVKDWVEDTKRAIIRVQTSAGNRMLYPALWTLEHKPALSGVASECTIKFHSELSGKCHHESEPIVITVGDAFLGKYGGYIKVGLNLFSSLVPDMFGKAAIDKVVEVLIEQIDKAVQVHSLVEELDLVSSNDRRDMSRDRSLSPNETLHLLRELLHVKYDSDFDVLKMTKYTGLECAIVFTRMTEPYVIASGTCVWASRDEIEQYTHALVFANDHVAPDSMASIHAATEEEWRKSREIAPEMEPQLSANHPSPCTERVESPGTDVTSRPTAMMMRIVSIQGLPNVRRVGKQRPYCRWRFIDINQRDVASDRTQPHDKIGLNPRWEAQPFWIKLPSDGATSFDGCTLYVMVETAGFVPGTCVMIAEGSHSFQDVAKTATIGKSDELSFNLSSSGKPAGRLHLAAKWDS